MSKKQPAPIPLLPNPHAWMTGVAPKAPPPPPKKETIREWYTRSTGWAGKVIVFVTLCSFVTMGIMWACAALPVLQRIQTFNGALTIPLIGGVWIFGFIFMFLVPSREASFRGQESLEEMGEIVRVGVIEKAAPAIEIWTRIGMRVEEEMPGLMRKFHDRLDEIGVAIRKIESAAENNGKFVDDAKPVVEALKRIETRLEDEIKTGLIEDVRSAAKGVKAFTGGDGSEPDYAFALQSVQQAQKAREGRTA